MKKAIIALASIVFLASCHANYDKTPSGLVYKIFPGKGGAKLATAKFVKLNVEYRIAEKDSVLFTTFGKFPKYSGIDTSGKNTAYSEMEILPKCSVGDSIEFSLSVDTLRNHNINLPLDIYAKGDHIKGRIKVIAAFNTREEIIADVNKEQELEKGRELKDVEAYMAKNNIKGQKTKNGAYVYVENAGEGMKADSGKIAMVLYKGYLLSNGKVFDTNMDSSKGHAGAYPVKVGAHGVIPGWEEGLPYFGKGGKGKILVPAVLGYGPQPQGNDIPANSNLVFDIEVTDVRIAPPPAPAPPQGFQRPQINAPATAQKPKQK
jgi:FKBP-type peptidyl-prolyl cis-trans isomerase FkpA